MHSCVKFYVDRKTFYALSLCSMDEGVEQTERIDLGLQVVVEHRSE